MFRRFFRLFRNSESRFYRNDQNGIMRRYIQESLQWKNHLGNSKKSIRTAVSCYVGGKVAILGSGWLLDVPMVELLAEFDEVHLFDIVHPPQIIHRYRDNSKVIFHTKDLTMGLVDKAPTFHSANEIIVAIRNSKAINIFDQYDFVISLNLLNQLDILFLDFVKQEFNINAEDEQQIRKNIQLNHINSLPKGRACLISDVKEFSYHIKTEELKSRDLIYIDLSGYDKIDSWQWDFDNNGTYNNGYITYFNVEAYLL